MLKCLVYAVPRDLHEYLTWKKYSDSVIGLNLEQILVNVLNLKYIVSSEWALLMEMLDDHLKLKPSVMQCWF